ncbi:hypothetical protein FNV43_RR13426 [Rhamnella rubrinervis]|uniref:Uncharacterized protein n=1 Tax=Rhamnella rubrinervis TaxID=2594499 RepID=A0A8K0MF64_9ROSA|nr:hypothetical protein FNV43_RR13426 [Rhamnella rubrinervis]
MEERKTYRNLLRSGGYQQFSCRKKVGYGRVRRCDSNGGSGEVCAGLSSRLQEYKSENAQLEELLFVKRELRKSYEARIKQIQQDLSVFKNEVTRVKSNMAEALAIKNFKIEALVSATDGLRKQATISEGNLASLQEEGRNDQKIGKLCEYASKNPLCIPKISLAYLLVMDTIEFERIGIVKCLARLFAPIITDTAVLLFALENCALASKASGSGVVRGAGLGSGVIL